MKYRVVGAYGVHADECIEKFVSAETKQEASKKFARHVKRSYPVAWKRMGYINITVYDVE